ncbi:hypothetical protein Ais01nite_67910 [Asanoa ishikariensis]|uniref:Uncharacterized protein n=2 Tax=Asanoa ishikariensis TaxID=137265 RepID=A0A1H3NB90_9ACTN|nr:hypothetical protein Ais01nite_67910 [Asanoa ishikariensis]SDY85745.1 hypothetical protein SAMN05421684_1937 [Asanoa ishikariensis]
MAIQRDSTGDAAMRSLPSIFEAACLIRCTGVGRSPGARPLGHDFGPGSGPAPGPTSGSAIGTLTPGASFLSGGDTALPGPSAAPAYTGAALRAGGVAVLAEFNQPEAAERLSRLLADLGVAASWATLVGGGRRQYFVHRVTIPGSSWVSTVGQLAAGWRQGRHFLLRTDPVGASSPHNARREALARRAWQAASLAAGRQRRGGLFGVRLADQEMAAVLVRSARLLGATASIRSRPGCLQVSVTSVTSEAALLEITTPPLRVAS